MCENWWKIRDSQIGTFSLVEAETAWLLNKLPISQEKKWNIKKWPEFTIYNYLLVEITSVLREFLCGLKILKLKGLKISQTAKRDIYFNCLKWPISVYINFRQGGQDSKKKVRTHAKTLYALIVTSLLRKTSRLTETLIIKRTVISALNLHQRTNYI